MNRILNLALKDITQLTRDRMTLMWAFGFPLMFGALFGTIYGGSGDGPKASQLAFIDLDHSKESQALADRLSRSDAVKLIPTDYAAAKEKVRKGDYAAYLVVPSGFGKADRSFQGARAPLKMGIDPGKKAEAGLLEGVIMKAAFEGIGQRFNDPQEMRSNATSAIANIRKSDMSPNERASYERFMQEIVRFSDSRAASKPRSQGGADDGMQMARIETENVLADQGVHPMSAYEVTFPQGILWGLISLTVNFAVSLVRERQQGTMARLRSSPMSFAEILAGEGLACFLSCCVVMTVFMCMGAVLFHVRVHSVGFAAMAIAASSLCFVGVMVLLSSMAKTTQAASGSVWGVLMLCAVFGGGMMPMFMMPAWMQSVGTFSPLKWSTLAMEGAIWRGFSFTEMLFPISVLLSIGVVTFAFGVRVLSRSSD